MNKINATLLSLVALIMLGSCEQKKPGEWMNENLVKVAIDETFSTIMDEEVEQFGKLYPEANMQPYYVTEDSAIHMLIDDSVRCCIATRRLTDLEREIIKRKTGNALHSVIAYDGIALVTSRENPDSLITVDELRDIINGKITHWNQLAYGTRKEEIKVVFDNSRSSTVRYMTDSLCHTKKLEGNLYAQGSNLNAIEAARTNPNVIAIVGVDWLRTDSIISSFRDLDVQVMMVSRKSGEEADFFRPYQYYIATGDYPLVRSVYAITTDPRRRSSVKSFYFFLKDSKGQKIICNGSQLLPYAQVQVRDVNITD
ncbi:MAG: substrate-binding domain-containing protein [Bacteroidaceae bacterium]|nr:substrate-binding domain-containing protein [Bacteroidaceae bacterium]